jgi:hypothetical protein
MNSFQANGEGPVVPSVARDSTAEHVQARFDSLVVKPKLVQENNQLVRDLVAYKLNNDGDLQHYITSMKQKIMLAAADPIKLNQIKVELTTRRDLLAPAFPIAKENEALLDNILQYKVNAKDVLLQKYIDDTRQKLIENRGDVALLTEMKAELTQVLASVSSPQVAAVKEAAQALRDSVHWYTRRKLTKAELIENALCHTPLDQRGTVITQAGPANKVQEALASHRHLGKGGDVYKKGNEIDVENAANTFKKLKAQFGKQQEEVLKPEKDDKSSMKQPLLK